ncbi:radical SAM protein, partial [Candidatus Bathyarchaeota archaeon]|nr:radical SAM protein [Candidatus Bathyarchaeota archaeon]NIU80847.1 radical SAM protein [Candidatus Bathyarchaeota archaeon]
MRENPLVDIVCMAEGERTIVELAHKLERNGDLHDVKGIAHRSGDHIKVNQPRELIQNLDSLPFPARHLLPMDKYTVLGQEPSAGGIITSRGCPFQCVFCSSSLLSGKKFRARSPKNVVHEIEHLRHYHGISFVEFLDDLFTLDQERVVDICKEIGRRHLDVEWVCS